MQVSNLSAHSQPFKKKESENPQAEFSNWHYQTVLCIVHFHSLGRRQWLRGKAAREKLWGSWFHPAFPQSLSGRVFEQDSEPRVAPGELVGALHGFLRHQCMNECACVCECNAQSMIKRWGIFFKAQCKHTIFPAWWLVNSFTVSHKALGAALKQGQWKIKVPFFSHIKIKLNVFEPVQHIVLLVCCPFKSIVSTSARYVRACGMRVVHVDGKVLVHVDGWTL